MDYFFEKKIVAGSRIVSMGSYLPFTFSQPHWIGDDIPLLITLGENVSGVSFIVENSKRNTALYI